jgi:hypothetical protein
MWNLSEAKMGERSPDVLNRKEEFQVEKPPTEIQALRAIFQGENNTNKR